MDLVIKPPIIGSEGIRRFDLGRMLAP
jgi:hypothetical protein